MPDPNDMPDPAHDPSYDPGHDPAADYVLAMEEDAGGPPAGLSPAALEAWTERLGALLLADAPEPDAPPPAAVWTALAARLGPPVLRRGRDEGEWFEICPGGRMKMLMVDPPSGARTALVRLAPGAVLDTHHHDLAEECLVLEGDIEVDARAYGPGDYLLAPEGSDHFPIPTRGGVLLLLRWCDPGFRAAPG